MVYRWRSVHWGGSPWTSWGRQGISTLPSQLQPCQPCRYSCTASSQAHIFSCYRGHVVLSAHHVSGCIACQGCTQLARWQYPDCLLIISLYTQAVINESSGILRALQGRQDALFNPRTSSLFQKLHPYTGGEYSVNELSGDSKPRFYIVQMF